MNTTLARVKCGNCHNYHESAAQVKACYFPPAPVQPVATVVQSALTVEWATDRQLDYITKLGGDAVHAAKLTKFGASQMIDRLKREGVKTVQEDAPNRQTTKIPLAMLHAVPDGYYATRQDSTRPYSFFRFSRPKGGNFKGALKIQTQHGPDLKLALVIYPGDRLYWSNMAVEDDLLLVVVDTNGSAIAYADEIGNCMRCNTELTDERSRWFGIGPECEKHWPQMIDLVTDRKGPFVHGWELKSE